MKRDSTQKRAPWKAARFRNPRWLYAIALLPVATDWVDTGHFPHHIQEWTTELITGALIFAGVHLLIRQSAQLTKLAQSDTLTGLWNRARFDDDLQSVLGSHHLLDSWTLVYLDVDDFKDINDRYGHLAGDDLLRCIGRALRIGLRQGDHSYRIGGDEIAILMRAKTEREAVDVVARALSKENGLAFTATCSAGASKVHPGGSIEQIVAVADQRMYVAKRGGEGEASATLHVGSGAPKSSTRQSYVHLKRRRA